MAAGCRFCDGILCSEIQYAQDVCYCDSKKDCVEKEVVILKKDDMEEEVEFLRKWSFVPGELTSPLLATGDYVTLFCNSDGSQFFAHSLILVNRSEVFRKMLEEVDLKEKETREVVIQEVGGESLKTFLKFLYTAQVSSEEMQANYRELVKLAHFYQVKLLLVKLDKFISSEIVMQNNCVEILKMAYLYDLEITREAALNVIARDVNDELYDVAFEELQLDHPWMARDLSKSLYKRLRTDGCGKNKKAVTFVF